MLKLVSLSFHIILINRTGQYDRMYRMALEIARTEYTCNVFLCAVSYSGTLFDRSSNLAAFK